MDESRGGGVEARRQGYEPQSSWRRVNGPELPHRPDNPNPNAIMRRSTVEEEIPSLDVTAPLRASLGGSGKLGDGEGAPGFRCELVPNLDAYINLIQFLWL